MNYFKKYYQYILFFVYFLKLINLIKIKKIKSINFNIFYKNNFINIIQAKYFLNHSTPFKKLSYFALAIISSYSLPLEAKPCLAPG